MPLATPGNRKSQTHNYSPRTRGPTIELQVKSRGYEGARKQERKYAQKKRQPVLKKHIKIEKQVQTTEE
jgi:hypothetical protein